MRLSPGNNESAKNRGCVLIISGSQKTTSFVKETLAQEDFSTVSASSKDQALSLITNEQILYILIDTDLAGISSYEIAFSIRSHIGDYDIPIIVLVSADNVENLSCVLPHSYDDFLVKPLTAIALTSRIALLEKMRKLECLYKSSVNEQLVAKRILTNALDERTTHLDYIKLLSRSKEIFSGDLFITARHQDGSLNILIADFTGHGLPASICALPIVEVFSVMTDKGFDLEKILESINRKLHSLLPTGMFMACGVLNVASDLKYVSIWNGGMPDVYIREHKTGNIVHKIQSTHVPLGINKTILNRFELTKIALTPGDELILYSDGLTEAMNSDGDMFGYKGLDECLHNNKNNEFIFTAIVDEFNKFCAECDPIDDVTLAYIPCNSNMMRKSDIDSYTKDAPLIYELTNSSMHKSVTNILDAIISKRH